MPKTILFALLTAYFSCLAMADDGSWSDSRGYTPAEGALYSVEGNPDIALEKEYLELSDFKSGATRAVFLFRNGSNRPLRVECAFPLSLEWYSSEIAIDAAGNPTSAENPGARKGWDYGAQGKYSPRASGPYDHSLDSWLSVLGIRSADWIPDEPGWGGKFIAENNFPKGRLDLPAHAFASMLSLSITQDGAKVPISKCVVDFGEGPDSDLAKIGLHFRHSLSFAPGTVSRVEVAYAFPCGSEASGDPTTPGYVDTYAWKYVLETGSTWKGSIGSLVLAIPQEFSGDLPKPLAAVGRSGRLLLYKADNWEPRSDQNLDLSWREARRSTEDFSQIWFGSPREISIWDYETMAEGVKVLGGSSFLPDKADLYVATGVLKKVDFGPARLFDGIRESCWVEGKKGDGIGEYVRFSLDRRMGLVAVQNGFLRSAIDVPEKALWSFFEKNNRVKTLELRSDSGSLIASLALADTRELQYFEVDLPAGGYRAAIAAVYPGTTWRDTCLGELVFAPASGATRSAFLVDPFFAAFLKP